MLVVLLLVRLTIFTCLLACLLSGLTDTLLSLGVPNAYTLDGGQTSTLVFNGSTVNHVDYGNERYQSDIVFFATAIPAEERGQDDG